MNHSSSVPPRSAAGRRAALPILTLALAGGLTGCYHATGFQRPPLMASEIPPSGGDRVSGIKSAAGPGDYYIGNDFVGLAIDGTPFGEREGSTIAGAVSGGSLVDVGTVSLDSSFKQVPLSSDLLDRLTPVVNQDPELPLVFTTYDVTNLDDRASIEMRGHVFDPKGRISGGTRDAAGRLDGVEVFHRLELRKLDSYATLETTLRNNGSGSVGIRSIGDALVQKGAGFRLNIPATTTLAGQPVEGWGTDFDGGDFTRPLETSVKADMVALMGTEPADFSTDMHTSLGLVSDDWKPLAVVADAQKALTNLRPDFPRRMVAGSLPGDVLAAGKSLTHRRRLYINGAATTSPTSPFSNQATALFNRIALDRAQAQGTSSQIGAVLLTPFGSAARLGGTPTMFRFERNLGTADKPVWNLERTEWFEPLNTPSLSSYYSRLFGGMPTSQGTFELALPEGSYRIVTYNGKGERLVESQFHDATGINERPTALMPLIVKNDKPFVISTQDAVTPERNSLLTAGGSQARALDGYVSLAAVTANATAFQPARFTFQGIGTTPDPDLTRQRVLTGTYNVAFKQKIPGQTYTGAYIHRGGSMVFGVNFLTPYVLPLPFGSYRTYATHGPLAPLDLAEFTLDSYVQGLSRHMVSFEAGNPAGWVSFDVPGPTMATTGGIHPYESLSSALAEGVNVLGYTDEDTYPNIPVIRDEFRFEFDNASFDATMAKILGKDPFMVGGRTSTLEGRELGVLKSFGTATALFDHDVQPAARRNGARISNGWTLADFLAQGGGSFNVVHDPRGPRGLFTSMGFDRTVALGSGVNAWWNRTSTLSNGRTHGSFDAIELIRGEGCTPATAGAWWNTFKTVRLDWFALLNQQTPTAFTKGLGLSSSRTTMDTPVGLARTYMKAADLTQEKLSVVKEALQKGAVVASTGPLLDVTVNGGAPGSLVTGSTLSVSITVYAPDWVPVDEVRVVWNGQVVKTLKAADFTFDTTDVRKRTATVSLAAPKDGWVVVEAGAPLDATAPYKAGSPWNVVMKGILPVALTNPVFVDANSGGYTAPGL